MAAKQREWFLENPPIIARQETDFLWKRKVLTEGGRLGSIRTGSQGGEETDRAVGYGENGNSR